jgi:hypothetical protein
VGTAAEQVELNGLLAFTESVNEAAKSYERSSSVVVAGQGIARRRGCSDRAHLRTYPLAFVP